MKPALTRYRNITASGVTPIKVGPGVLHTLNVNKAVEGATITLYDYTSNAGDRICTITFPAALLQSQVSLLYNVAFEIGLTVETSHDVDITIGYR